MWVSLGWGLPANGGGYVWKAGGASIPGDGICPLKARPFSQGVIGSSDLATAFNPKGGHLFLQFPSVVIVK